MSLAGNQAWESTQARSFARWMNAVLAKRGGPTVTNIESDLCDGLLLATLLETLSGKKMGTKINPKPVFRIQRVNNLSVVLDFIKQQLGIRLENMGADDICSGNVKMILGLAWTLICHFQFAGLDMKAQMTAKGAVLEWANSLGIKVNNVTSDFEDGKVLCRIVDALRPGLIDMSAVDRQSPLDNVNMALNALEKHCGVPHIVDAEDIVSHPEEKSMITFLAELMRVKRAEGAEAPRAAPVAKVAVSPRPEMTSSSSTRKLDASLSASSNTVPSLLFAAAKQFPSARAYSDNMGMQAGPTWSEHGSQVAQAYFGFSALGVKRGDRVVVIGEAEGATRVAYLAIQCAGAIPVCIYARDQTLLEMAYAIQFSGARVMVVSSSGMWDKISARAADFDNIKTVVFGATTSPGAPPSGSKIQVVVWSELLAKASSSHVPSVLDVRPQDAAAWVFTAGVTGAPKAVVLTHNMLVEAGRAAQAHFNLNSEDVIASHLSFANALQQVLEIVLPCISGAQVTYCNPVADFRTICSTVAPTFIAGLPSEWHSLVQFFTSESAGKELAQLTDSEKKQLVSLSKLEKCRWPLCVWSAISVASCLEIRSLNIPLYRVYGLAEACGLVSLEGPGKSSSNIQLGVGIPIQGLEVKIGPNREVLLQGPTVCAEYAASKPDLVGGFLGTGDFGRLENGHLVLQGRLSDIFSLQSGAIVEPLDPESQLREHPFISHAVVVGRDQNFAVAFLTLDRSVMEPVAKQRGVSAAQLASSPQVASTIKSHVDRINASRPRDVRIRKFVILGAVHASKGELTATQYVRREEVIRHNRKASEALFSPDLAGDADRLKKVASGADKASVSLFSGPGVSNDYSSLWDLAEHVTYWTEDGNDVQRNGSSIILSGQEVATLTSPSAAADADELAIVNMLYAHGPSVKMVDVESGQTIEARSADDFDLGKAYRTLNGTSVVRSSDMLLIAGDRKVPLEIVVSEFGSEVGDETFSSSLNVEEVQTPNTPGSRRLADIRKNKEKEEAEKRRKAEERRLQREAREAEDRALQAERARLLQEQQEEQERFRQLEEEKEALRLLDLERRRQQELDQRRREEQEEQERRQRAEEQRILEEEVRREEEARRRLELEEAEQTRKEEERRRLEEEREEEERRRREQEEERKRREEEEEEERRREEEEKRREEEDRMRRLEEEEKLRREREAAAASADSSDDVELIPLLLVVGAESRVGRLTVGNLCKAEGAGEDFQVRAILTGLEESSADQQVLMRDYHQLSEAVYCDLTDVASSEDGLEGATRAIVFLNDDYRFDEEGHTEFANGISFFEAARNKNVGRIILVGRIAGNGSSPEFAMYESNMNAIIGEDRCCSIRSALTFEDLAGQIRLSEDGSSISSPIGSGKVAAISEADLAAFCARVLLRKDNVDAKYAVTGPTAVGSGDFAKAIDASVSDASENPVENNRIRRDELSSLGRGECEHVFIDQFEEVMKREPTSFDAWSEKNLEELKEQKRIASEAAAAKAPERKPPALATAAVARGSRSGSGWSVTDVPILLAKSASRPVNTCRLCSTPFGVTRWSATCCECDQVACRKCLRTLVSSVVIPKHSAVFGVPAHVCEECLPQVVRQIEAGASPDVAEKEVLQIGCVPSSKPVPEPETKERSKCSVCNRDFGRFRSAIDCTCCSTAVCHSCHRLVTSEVLDFPEAKDNALCETCVPDLKTEIRNGGLEAKLCEKELASLDLVTMGLRGPVELVKFPRDLSVEEQDTVIQNNKDHCHVCSSDFGFLLRPHRCGACARLVCSKDAVNHISSDLLVLNDAWVCTVCHPIVIEELRQKKRDNAVLEDLIDPDITVIESAFKTRNNSSLRRPEVITQPPAVVAVAAASAAAAPEPVTEVTAVAPVVEAVEKPVKGVAFKSCPNCSHEFSALVKQVDPCFICKDNVCSSCSYHFRSTCLGWGNVSHRICFKCVGEVEIRITAAGKEKPKQLGALAMTEVNPCRVLLNQGVFCPLEEPEFHDFSVKELKLLESGKSKCYSCGSKHDVLCSAVRCGKCKKVVCRRCTERFKRLGFVLGRQFGEVCICFDCWPGVKVELEHLANKAPSPAIAEELRLSIGRGDAALKNKNMFPLPLESKFQAKSLVKQKCHHCARKASPVRGLVQCDNCNLIGCTTCSGQFWIPEMKTDAFTRLCLACVPKCKDKIRAPDQQEYSVKNLTGKDADLVKAHPNCKHCQKKFDFWRRPHLCRECEVPSCWQCCTSSFQLNGQKSRVCRGCIEEAISGLDGEKDVKAFLETEVGRLNNVDRSQFLVEEVSDDEDAEKSNSKKAPLEKRPSFLRRTFSRKLKVNKKQRRRKSEINLTPQWKDSNNQLAVGSCNLCSKPFGLTRKEKMCAECSTSVCGGCSSEMMLASLKWKQKRIVCDKCLVNLRARVLELQDNPYDHAAASADLKILDSRLTSASASAPVSKKQAADELTAASPRPVAESANRDEVVASPAALVASPRPEDSIPDLENTSWNGGENFKWADVGLSADATPKEAAEFKLNHVNESLKRLAAMEASLQK